MQNSIEKTIDLKAPVSRVWRALTNHTEFGQWFQVSLDGPFIVGELSTGWITYPGYEHMKWQATVQSMEHESLFSFTWCPLAGGADIDIADEPKTLVKFKLEPSQTGTRLFLSESGFAELPDDPRRIDAMRKNSDGWDQQVNNIAAHVQP